MTEEPRIAVFITARTDSSRLPQKMLAEIRGVPVIMHDICRASQAFGAEAVVLCTSDRVQDDVLAGIAQRAGVKCFRGSLNDKLARWLGAADQYDAEYFITFDGDDLFCDPELLRAAAEQIKQNRPDFIQAPPDLICGAFTYAISRDALRKVCEIKGTDETEMQWVYFTKTGLFKVEDFVPPSSRYLNPNIRMTLDYPEDLQFFKTVFDELAMDKNDTPLSTILGLLERKPEIQKINYFRQAEFLANQKAKTKLVLKEDVRHEA